MMQGAGGTNGGIGQFGIGLTMMVGGFYLLLNAIRVRSNFGFSYGLYSFGGYSITSGIVMLPGDVPCAVEIQRRLGSRLRDHL